MRDSAEKNGGEPKLDSCIFRMGILNKNEDILVETVVAHLFKSIREKAIEQAGCNSQTKTMAILAKPTYFNKLQEDKLKEAASKAGFDFVECIPYPDATVQAYGVQMKNNTDCCMVINLAADRT